MFVASDLRVIELGMDSRAGSDGKLSAGTTDSGSGIVWATGGVKSEPDISDGVSMPESTPGDNGCGGKAASIFDVGGRGATLTDVEPLSDTPDAKVSSGALSGSGVTMGGVGATSRLGARRGARRNHDPFRRNPSHGR